VGGEIGGGGNGTRPRHPPRQSPWLWPANRAFGGGLSYLALRMRRSGQEHIPPDGPVLIVCTHVGFIDPLVLATAALPRRSWMMGKEELFRSAALASWMTRSGGFPVRRASPDLWAVRTSRDLLARGECLLMFPEGGVNRGGRLRPGFSGAGYLALRPGVTVIPAVVWNTQLLRGPARVRFGPPLPMDELRASARPGRNRRATERIMEALAGMVPLVGGPDQPAPTGKPWIPPPRGKGSISS
jgi:1-acyl-sn-glycerol-3-phosphate acyltransferase